MANYNDLMKKAALYRAAKQASGAGFSQPNNFADRVKQAKEKAQQPNVVITPKMNDYSFGRWYDKVNELRQDVDETGYNESYLQRAQDLARETPYIQHYMKANADRFEDFEGALENQQNFADYLSELEKYLKVNQIAYPNGIPDPNHGNKLATNAGQIQFLNTLSEDEKLEYLMQTDPARAESMLTNMKQRSENWVDIYQKQLEEMQQDDPSAMYRQFAGWTPEPTAAEKKLTAEQSKLDSINSQLDNFPDYEWYRTIQQYPEQAVLSAWKFKDQQRIEESWNYLSATNPNQAMELAQQIVDEMTASRQELVDQYNADPFNFTDAQDQRWAYMDDEITRWTARLNQATYQMEGVRMGDVAVEGSASYDPDFEAKSRYVQYGNAMLSSAGRVYEYLNSTDEETKRGIAATQNTLSGAENNINFGKLDYLKDTEKQLFNYYYRRDPEEAMHYLDTMQETLNSREAVESFANLQGKKLKEVFYGAIAGVSQFGAGVRSALELTSDSNYIPYSTEQILGGMVREDLGKDGRNLTGWQIAYDIANTTANMLPSVLVGTALGGVAGAVTIGVSAGGNAYQEALNSGYNKNQARLYGVMIGASEAALESIIGGISAASGAKNISTKIVDGLLSKVDRAIGRAALQLGVKAMSEGFEEYMQEIISPVLENVILNADNDISLVSEEAIYAGILGAVTSAPFNVVSGEFKKNRFNALAENVKGALYRGDLDTIVQRSQQHIPGSETLQRVQSQIERGGVESVSKRDIALLTDELAAADANFKNDMRKKASAEQEAKPTRETPINKTGTAKTDSGEAVTVRGVAYQDGNVLIRIADESGAERNVSRSTLALDDNVSDLVSLAEKYGSAAPDVYETYDNNMDFDRYADDVDMIMSMAKYSVGVNGSKALNWLKNDASIRMEPKAIDILFNAGREVGVAEQPLIRRGGGKVTFAKNINRAALSPKQKAQVDFVTELSKLLGINVEFFMSEANKAGELVGENGSYKDNRIRIDLNAGRNYASDSMAKIAITRTASHELTHWLKDVAPVEYQLLRDFIVEKMIDEGGTTLEDLVKSKQLRAKGGLNFDEAIDEIVADGCELMLGKSEYIREYAKRNQEGYNKIRNWLKKFLEKLRKAFKGVDSAHKESVILMEKYAEELLELWDNALKSGLENPATAPVSSKAKVTVKAKTAAKVGMDVDAKTESVAPAEVLSERTWVSSDYVKARDTAAAEIAEAIGVSAEKAKAYIDDVNSIARMIAEDRTRLDYFSSPFRSSFISNVEYGGSFDFSTLCKKRRLLTGTFTAIQKALPNTALTANEILDIRNRMKEAGLEVSCGLCYVEGSRANMGQFAKEFLRLYKQYYPDAWQPNMVDVNTPDGVEWMRLNHPEAYEQYEYFWNHYGTLKPGDKNLFASQQKPKLYQLHTEYKGEILSKFENDGSEEAKKAIDTKNKNGGIRLQSFSDFEIVHLIDCMQIIMDMSRVGLAGQAYTKVPDFAWALGDTGLKINLSLIAKGVDENGKLIFDDVEGMPIAEAMKLRDRYSKNVGTILVAFNDEQLLAAMADNRVDFIIPFHRSQWKKSQYTAMGLPAKTKDYTFMQNEKFIKPQYHEYRGRMVKDKATNYMPNDYWDFNKTGKENAEDYLAMCAANNKRPKFYKLLQNNGDGSYSLKADGSTDGYWKLLIDFKMYDNDGVGSPQLPVRPEFNMTEATRMLNEYRGGHSQFPVAQGIVDDFVTQYKAEHKGEKLSAREQYSYRGVAEDGKKVYESNFPKGTPKSAKSERILRLIQDVWSKKPITLTVQDESGSRQILAYFDPTYDETGHTPTDASKLMGGNRHGTSSDQRVTLDLADDYYQIASDATYNYSKQEEGKATDPHQGVKIWHYFINDIYFAEHGSDEFVPYRVSINVKEKTDGHFFYSFSAEKIKESASPRTLHAAVNSGDAAKSTLSNERIAQENGIRQPSSEKKSLREYTITDREMLKNLNAANVNNEQRGYVRNFQSALKDYEESYALMMSENARATDSKLSKAQREEARKRGLKAQRKMEEADRRLQNMETMPKVKQIVSAERAYIEKRTTLEESQIAPEAGRYAPAFEQRITDSNEERRARLTKYYGQVEFFGAIPAGETPARDVAVPRRTAKDNKVSQTVRTALEASITDLDTSIALQEKIQEDGFSYIPISDESAKAVAQQNLAGKTWGEALADFTKKMEKGRVTKYDVAEGFYLYNSAIQNGDTKTAVNILTELTARIREGAQMVQAVRILKQLSPEHKMYALTRSIRALQEQIDKQHGENAPKIEMDPELLDNYLNAKTEEEIDEAKQKLYQDIAQQIPRTFVYKWNAWRYLAMLGNPKTILRNTLGNALFMPVVEAKNAVGAGLERLFVKDKSQRTKSLAVNGRKDLRLLGLDDYKSVESVIQGSGKYNDQENISGELAEAIREFKSTFNAPVIRQWQKATNYLMNDSKIGDYGFLRAHYSNAFAAVCMARGITAEDVSNGKVKQSELDSIRAYAIKEAQKATYRDANAFSNAIRKLRFKGDSKAAKVGNVFLEGILPFKSTPANVLVRAVEYSPIGAIKTIAVDSFKVKSGDMSATEFIDNLSSGLTGTALAALGWLLGRLGMLITDVDDDEERMGRQPYALQIGDTSYTLDWLAPEAVPLFVGAAIANIRERDEDVSWFEALFDSMTDMLQPMLELSMLSGVQDLLETMQYGDNGVDAGQLFYAFLINPAINYASQAVPTLLSQVANTFEKTSGFTYTGDIGGTMSKNLVRSIVKIIEKFPFVDVRQADFVDEWGRTENKGNLIQRFISSFISPGYTSEIMVTDADVELERLEEATGTNVAPTRRGYTITTKDDDGKSNKVKLDVNQYEAYSREYGTQAAMMMAVLMSSTYYADMSDADKVKALQNVNQLADEYGKIASGVGYEIQAGDSEKKLFDLTSTGLPIAEAYAAKIYHNSLDDNRDIKLNDKAIMFENWVAGQNWNETQKQAVMDAYGTFWTMVASDTEPYNNFANSTGLGEAEYFALNQAKTDQADGHWSQAELKDYLSGTEYTKAQKAAIFDMIFPKAKSNPYK